MFDTNNEKRPKLIFLTKQLVERIIDEAMTVLERVGVRVEDEEGLQILNDGGARIDKEKQRAFIPRKAVEDSLSTAPGTVTLYDRGGKKSVALGEDNFHFMPATGSIQIWDSDLGQIRNPVMKDSIALFRVNNAMSNIALQANFVYPTDVPSEMVESYRTFLSLRYGVKPGGGTIVPTPENIKVTEQLMLAVRGSEEELIEKPLRIFPAPPISPLRWSAANCNLLIRFAKKGIPVSVAPAVAFGATAPITIIGAITQSLAEYFSGMVITQICNPRSVVFFGFYPQVLNMRSGSITMGNINTTIYNAAMCEFGSYLHIPTYGYPAISGSNRLDTQTGLEVGHGIILAALAGMNIIAGVGGIGNGFVMSSAKVVIDNEIAGMAYHLLKGIKVRSKTFAEDLFTGDLSDSQHFLISPITMKWFREEINFPGTVINQDPIYIWQEKGCKTTEELANEKVKEILATDEQDEFDPNIEKEMINILTRQARKYGIDKLPLP